MARSGLSYLRDDLRQLTDAGLSDWTVGAVSYFNSDMLDTILDKHAEPFSFELMDSLKPDMASSGAYSWTRYQINGAENIEQTTGGTAIFIIQDQSGAVIPSSSYSVNYRTGLVTFTADTQGAPYYATGWSYDINGAAADIWRMKANHAANSFDFTTDNHSIKRSQVYQQYMKQADFYQAKSWKGGAGKGAMVREDTDAC